MVLMEISTHQQLAELPHGAVIIDANGTWARKQQPRYPDRNPWHTFGSTDPVNVQLPTVTVSAGTTPRYTG